MMLDALCVCAQARLRACVFVRARLQYGGLSSPPRVHVQCVCVCYVCARAHAHAHARVWPWPWPWPQMRCVVWCCEWRVGFAPRLPNERAYGTFEFSPRSHSRALVVARRRLCVCTRVL